MITEERPEKELSEQSGEADGSWRSLTFGVAALLLGLAPLAAEAIAYGVRADEAGGSAEVALALFGDSGAGPSMLVMTLGFLGLALRFWRVSRGPIRALPALFVTTAGLVILVGSSVASLSHTPERAWTMVGFALGYLALGALAFVLLLGKRRVIFTLGCALLYLPALYWLAGLLRTALREVGAEMSSYVPYLLAALLGLALGKLGWSTTPRLAGWLGVFLLLTVGVAAQSTVEASLSLGSQEQVVQWFWLSLASMLTPAGIAMVVGILIAMIDARRK